MRLHRFSTPGYGRGRCCVSEFQKSLQLYFLIVVAKIVKILLKLSKRSKISAV